MTRAGHAALDDELRQLKSIERPAVIRAIAEAREHGDLSENAEYHAALEIWKAARYSALMEAAQITHSIAFDQRRSPRWKPKTWPR